MRFLSLGLIIELPLFLLSCSLSFLSIILPFGFRILYLLYLYYLPSSAFLVIIPLEKTSRELRHGPAVSRIWKRKSSVTAGKTWLTVCERLDPTSTKLLFPFLSFSSLVYGHNVFGVCELGSSCLGR